MIEYILDGKPIKVKPEHKEFFEKQNPNAVIKSDEPGKSTGTSQSQNNQQTNTESNLGDGSLELPKNELEISRSKVDSLNNVLQNFNHEAKLEQIEKQINKIADTNYQSEDAAI